MNTIQKRIGLFIFLFVFFFLSFFQTYSRQIGTPLVKNYSRKEYKAGTQNWSIGQDKKSIMFFGNNKGLLEFDGTTWNIHTLPNATIVRSFLFKGDSGIYVGGQNEIGLLKADEKGSLKYHSLLSSIQKNDLGFEDIWNIFEIDGEIYFCSQKAILIYDGQKIKTKKLANQRFENFFLVEDKLIVQVLDEGLYLLEKEKFIKIHGSEIFKGNRIIGIIERQDEARLYVTRSGKIYFLIEEKFEEWIHPSTDFLKKSKPYCALVLSDQRIAIGSSQNGLIIIDFKGNPLLHINQQSGLQNNTILSLYQDQHFNLWLGLDNGIDYVEINSSFSAIGLINGIKGTGYSSVLFEDRLYLGTNQGLYSFDWTKEINPFEELKFEIVDEAVGQIWSLNILEDNLIVSRHEGALYKSKKGFRTFSDIQGAWKFEVLKNYPNVALEGTYDGFYVYERHEDNSSEMPWKRARKLKGFDESARVFEEDTDGKIWISHPYKGLFRLTIDPQMDSILKIESFDTTNGLPDNLYINVAKVRNEIVFTTRGGVFVFDQHNQEFVENVDFTKIFGSNRRIHRMLEDELGNVWFSIDEEFGVLKVHEKGVFNEYEIFYFNQINEDLVDGFEDIYALDESNVFIGTEKGFIHFNPSKISGTSTEFQVWIRAVTSITDSDSIIFQGVFTNSNSNQNYEFNNRLNDFRFDFSAPYYDKIDNLEYRYKLEGFDDSWSKWSNKTQKEYTNLKEGNYRFLVQARNAYGQLSKEDRFSFQVNPPWFFNAYSKSAYVLIFLLLMTLMLRTIYRREEIKRRKLSLEQLQKLKIKEEEFQKEFEKSENEIIKLRNEKLRADIGYKNSQLASATMHLVQKSEILMKLKNDLVNLIKEAPTEFRRRLNHLSRTIDEDIQLDNNWEQFELYFDQVHENFFKRLRQTYPDLTPKDQKLCAYLRMNLTTKEIAPLLNISVRGVEISRYRLRKKLGLDSNANLVAHIMDI